MKAWAHPGRRLAFVAGTALLLCGALAFFLPLRDWTDVLEDALEERNLVAALLVFCAIQVVGSLLMVPAWIFPVAAGAAFGPGWGLVASLVSGTIGATAAFLVARHLARERVERAARRVKTFEAVDKAVRHEPFKVVALLRLSPVLPSGLKSYLLGLTCVHPRTYVLATALGMAPGIALKVYVGHAGRGVLGAGGPLKWALLAAGLAATVALALIVGRLVKRRLGL